MAQTGLSLATARGNRPWEEMLNVLIASANLGLGHWEEAVRSAPELGTRTDLIGLGYMPILARIHAARDDRTVASEDLRCRLDDLTRATPNGASDRPSPKPSPSMPPGDTAEALEVGLPIAMSGSDTSNEDRREAYMEAGRAALAVNDESTAERLIEHVAELPPTLRSPCFAPARRCSPACWPAAVGRPRRPMSG